ncbi:MAG: AAA family ATPase [Trueperaceae bacterium]|nr:AAA family ATPase [Trueperaceae bacterium]
MPDGLAGALLTEVLEGVPEHLQDLVAWVKQGVEARTDEVDEARRVLPPGPITDRLRSGDVRVVKIAPGRGGVLWQEFVEAGIAAVGWDDVGDLRAYADFDAFRTAFRERYPYGGSLPASTKKAREVWTLRELKPGDLVVANRGIGEVLGIGEVIQPAYGWRDDRGEYRHTVRVRWDERYQTKIPPQRYWAVVTVLDLEPDALLRLLQADPEGIGDSPAQRVRLLKVPSSKARLREFVGDGATGDRVSLPVGEHEGNADLEKGDVLVLWQSGDDDGLHGLGEVLSSPQEDPDDPEGSRTVDVRITGALAEPIPSRDVAEDHALSGLEVLQAPSRSVFVVEAPEWEALGFLLSGDVPPSEDRQPGYDVQDVVEATGLPNDMLERWIRSIHRKGQAILYGPPGTGKTYVAKELAKHLVAGTDGFVQVLQFHAATAYEDFIQGLRPEIDASGNLSYVLAPGGFLRFVREARGRRGVSVLILDEINRADLARVFGELMYLLEYRDETVALAAGGKKLSVPKNVRILGTMNTADRSVALVDHALRRRFAFLRLQPDLELLRNWHRGKAGERLADRLTDELARLHRRIDDPHLALGISYFLVEDLPMHLPDIWRMEIEPYLEELFFDEADPLGEFVWEALAVRLDLA